MKTPKSPEELTQLAEMGVWFKDVRETQGMNIPEFGRFIGLKDAEIKLIEAGKHPIDLNIQKLIKRRTGREFGENLEFIKEVKESPAMDIPVTRIEEERYPEIVKAMEKIVEKEKRVTLKPGFIEKRKKELAERKSSRVPKNMEERKRVSDWLRQGMKSCGLSQKTLADASGVPEHTIRDLVYLHSRLMDDARIKIGDVFAKNLDQTVKGMKPSIEVIEAMSRGIERSMADRVLKPQPEIICKATNKQYILSKEISSGEVKLTLDINFTERNFSIYQDNMLSFQFFNCQDPEKCLVTTELIREAIKRAEMELAIC